MQATTADRDALRTQLVVRLSDDERAELERLAQLHDRSLADLDVPRAEAPPPYCAPDDLVFCTKTGKPQGHGNALARGLCPALDRAALPRTSFHSLRHTHASLWIKDGGDVITLSKRLGHATPQVTMTTYADEIEEANDSAIRRARVNARFGATKMAARMATSDSDTTPDDAISDQAEVISPSDRWRLVATARESRELIIK